MADRSRLRVGRGVAYNPTTAEAAANGAGPWPALIVGVNADDSVNLLVHVPAQTTIPAVSAADPAAITELAVGADPISTADADATYGAEEATLINEIKDDLNGIAPLIDELRTTVIATRALVLELKATAQAARSEQQGVYKTSVTRGQGLGQYDFHSGSLGLAAAV